MVETLGRKGTFVRSARAAGSPDASAAVASYVATCRALGLTRSDAVRLVEERWQG